MRKINLKIPVLAVVLSVFGAVMIYSASSYSAQRTYGDAFFYVKKQVFALILGIFAMTALIFVDLDKLRKYSWVFYAAGLVLLAAVFVPGLGVESYGAKRWLNLGITTVQPSEYAKFTTVFFLADFMAERDMRKTKNLFAALAIGMAECVLIILEPNMSITVCAAAVVAIMVFAGGAKRKSLAALGGGAALALPALIVAEPYRMKRLLAYIDPWSSPKGEGYQLIQSYYALGSGGLFGVGLFGSRQKYLFLPFSESDFILSVIGEELGLFGVASVLALFVVFLTEGARTAVKAKNAFGCYLAIGITAVVSVQVLVNAAVVSGSIPPTGLPLPFMSAGGSSLVAFLAATGLLTNVSATDNGQTFSIKNKLWRKRSGESL
ncbi:stage V sporulation protein E [Faecalibacterium sp. CAG:1138]|nr:stage V sporulation protein E [Faecalibacterium sp. CAG:1138]